MPTLVDSHCHLERETYGDELPAVLARARAAGVAHFVAVGASRVAAGADEALALAMAEPDVACAIGIHPNEAASATAKDVAHIDALAPRAEVVAIGEVGLDWYYGTESRERQVALFAEFVEMAKKHEKPLMMHIRDAHADCLRVLDSVGLPAAGGVIHCFTGGPSEAAAYLERGLYLSIPGVVTFKNAKPLQAAVAEIPLERMLVETDCPYLTPHPLRGKRNEPAYVAYTAAAVAQLRGQSPTLVAEATTESARRLFGLPRGTRECLLRRV